MQATELIGSQRAKTLPLIVFLFQVAVLLRPQAVSHCPPSAPSPAFSQKLTSGYNFGYGSSAAVSGPCGLPSSCTSRFLDRNCSIAVVFPPGTGWDNIALIKTICWAQELKPVMGGVCPDFSKEETEIRRIMRLVQGHTASQ